MVKEFFWILWTKSFTTASGVKTRSMGLDDWFKKMMEYMRGIGCVTVDQVREHLYLLITQVMPVNGRIIISRERERSYIITVTSILGILSITKKRGSDLMREISPTILSTMKGSGKQTKSMARGCIDFITRIISKAIGWMTKGMVSGYMSIVLVNVTRETGKMTRFRAKAGWSCY